LTRNFVENMKLEEVSGSRKGSISLKKIVPDLDDKKPDVIVFDKETERKLLKIAEKLEII